MRILNKLNARLSRVLAKRAANSEKGLGLGAIILIVILLVAIGMAASRFGGDSPNGDKQQVKLDSGALAQQVVQLRNGVTLLNSSADFTWEGVANKGGKLSLASATKDITESHTVPEGPTGTDRAAIKWTFGSQAGSGLKPTVFVWSTPNLSLDVCKAINIGLGAGGAGGTPAEVSLADIATATAQTLASGNTDAFTVNTTLGTALTTALGGKTASCVESDAAVYRVVGLING